uniref:Flavin-containing monooxygenase n=1 Tax=Dicentrarchus labrax TaxID=13489 RepID=A0A8C4DP77_DICLA
LPPFFLLQFQPLSKERMAFSDFPPPAELPNNMHHSEMLQYLRLYAQTTVVSVRQRLDFDATGQWEVETERTEGQRETIVFDAVIVCTGHFTKPHLPLTDFPGIESFEGRYFHSWDYHSAEGLQGKRVVGIWIWSSGGDIAVDISRVAQKVYLSTRSGAWVVSRVGEGGLPLDMLGMSRMDMMLQKLFPSRSARMLEKKVNKVFNHGLYGLKPKHGIFVQNAVVSDDLPAQIISGHVQVKPNVKEFCGSSVVFVDGIVYMCVIQVDVVVFATGFNYSFPFLPSTLQAKSGYRLCLYKHVFPPALSQPTLAVVGFIHGLGSITPLAEMQARWATRVNHSLLLKYFFNHLLALQVLLGPCTSYQYRLTGPGQWAGARQAILTQWERVVQPFRTRVIPEPKTRPSSTRSIIVISSGAALLCYFFYNKHRTSISFPLSFCKS